MKFKLPLKTIEIIDRKAAGQMVRDARENAKISLRKLAGAMKITPPYLSDMELGRRGFNEERFTKAMTLIERLSK
jgi:transcriptional regulator with XRE-family HTH domain